MEPVGLLLIVLLFSFLFGELSRKLGGSRVAGQLLAGIVLSLPFFGFLFSVEANSFFLSLSEIGKVLLFFLVGLEVNFWGSSRIYRDAFFVTVFNTLVPFLACILALPLFGMSVASAAVVGLALAASSLSIPYELLSEYKLVFSRIGSLIVTAGAFEHLFELVLVAVVIALIGSSVLVSALVGLLAGFGLLLVCLLSFRFFLLPRVLVWLEADENEVGLFSGIVILSLFLAFLSLQLGLGSLLGALVGGIMVRNSILSGRSAVRLSDEKIGRLIRLVSAGFFVPIFFVWVGTRISLASVASQPWLSVALVLLSFLSSIGGTLIGFWFLRRKFSDGIVVSMAMAIKGGLEMGIASLALELGIIDVAIFSALVLVTVVSSFVSPAVFRRLLLSHCVGREPGLPLVESRNT